jgi:hypothetical protein
MLEDLVCRSPVSSADDKHGFWVRMGHKGRMNHILMIKEFIPF